MKDIEIQGRTIVGKDKPVYLIAEMSANHAGSLAYAKEIIHAAKEAGADCIKLQTYTPDTLTIDCDNEYFQVSNGTWKGENLYQLYGKAYTPWEWHKELKEEAERVGIDFFSTPFDKTAVDFLEELGVDFYKIASFELVDIPLVEYVASKGKPIIMSTGMASISEIQDAVQAIRSHGNEDIVLLRCASAYPAITNDMNLKTMQNMSEIFDVPIGLSDHSMGSVGAITAVALGAKVIEKHFCLDRAIENPDSSFSMTPSEYKQMVSDIRQAEKAIGRVQYGISEQEKSSAVFRRSIFCVKDIKKGEIITEENVRIIRPGYGLLPKYYPEILGQEALVDIKRGTPMKFEIIGKAQVLFLTNNPNAYVLYDWLKEKCQVSVYNEKLSLTKIKQINPKLIISYNYKYRIDNEVIEYMQGNIINLHISYLPWNRGADPNIWSFIDETPKGVTIHQISPELDKGKILYQKECFFEPEHETFETTYEKLNHTMIELFQEKWEEIWNKNYQLMEQIGEGSYHRHQELDKIQEQIPFQWSDNIADFLRRYREKREK